MTTMRRTRWRRIEFTHDEPGFDGFAQAHIVGNEEVDTGQAQGFAQGLRLVILYFYAGAVGAWKRLGSAAVTRFQ